jgi:peptidoglycan/xylan/chitin deacetylase (PgdA/CDA1 family)
MSCKAIMYHYVREFNPEFPEMKFLHINSFRKQLDYFQSKYHILHPVEFANSVINKKVPNGIILTFDDGLKDHFDYVVPELVKRNLSAIFYISSKNYTDNVVLNVHRLHLLLAKFGGEEIYKSLLELVSENEIDKRTINQFQKITYRNQCNDYYTTKAKQLVNYFLKKEIKDDILLFLMKEYFGDEQFFLKDFYLQESEVLMMHNAGMLIGNHSHSHQVLSTLSKEVQLNEIHTSFNYLDSLTGCFPFKTFCYPYGGFQSFNTNTENILDNSDVVFSFNVEPRNIEKEDILKRPNALPRYDCNMFMHGSVYGKTSKVYVR